MRYSYRNVLKALDQPLAMVDDEVLYDIHRHLHSDRQEVPERPDVDYEIDYSNDNPYYRLWVNNLAHYESQKAFAQWIPRKSEIVQECFNRRNTAYNMEQYATRKPRVPTKPDKVTILPASWEFGYRTCVELADTVIGTINVHIDCFDHYGYGVCWNQYRNESGTHSFRDTTDFNHERRNSHSYSIEECEILALVKFLYPHSSTPAGLSVP